MQSTVPEKVLAEIQFMAADAELSEVRLRAGGEVY